MVIQYVTPDFFFSYYSPLNDELNLGFISTTIILRHKIKLQTYCDVYPFE